MVNRADKGEQDATARSTLILFRLSALGGGKVATKDRKLWNSSAGLLYAAWPIHEYEVENWTMYARGKSIYDLPRDTL